MLKTYEDLCQTLAEADLQEGDATAAALSSVLAIRSSMGRALELPLSEREK